MNKIERDKDDASGGEAEEMDFTLRLESDEEYSENERQLLKKAYQKNHQVNYDSEDEVMGFSDENDDIQDDMDKDSMASDIEGLTENFELPNEKAWGKKKRAYYSTDYVDADYASASQKDIADAELEEQEAGNLQKRLAEELDENDFGLDLIVSKDDDSAFDKDNECIKTDLSKLSKRQKRELLEKESPEFIPLITDFQDRITEARTLLGPFIALVEKNNCKDNSTINFVRKKYDLLLHYCTNISFYLMLKANKESVNSHPVIRRLAQYRQLLAQLEEHQGNLLDEIKEILIASINGQPLYNTSIDEEGEERLEDSSVQYKKLKSKISNEDNIMLEEDSNVRNGEHLSDGLESDENNDNNDETVAEKRAITYQIAKNKGLTPHRKKEQRNPRVKHRNKYRKAKIRRKGAVREVRKETTRYGGEISGIKTSVKKSIKLK